MSNKEPSGSVEVLGNEEIDVPALSRAELCTRLTSAGVKWEVKDSTDRLKQKLIKHVDSLKDESENLEKVDIAGQTTATNDTSASEIVTMEFKIKLEFELGKDDWEIFIERLDLFFMINNVTDDKKQAAIWLTKVSPDTYKLARNLCHPTKLKDKTYGNIVKMLSDHLCPKPSETMERCNFYAAKQAMTETVSDFVARLKELSLNCNFSSVETALRDQLVCGLHDHATKTELFKEGNLTYEKAYKIALAREKAEKDATLMEKMGEASGPEKEIRALGVKYKNSHNNGSNERHTVGRTNNNNIQYSKATQRQETPPQSQPASDRNKNKKQDLITCYCCGNKGHIGRECRHRYKVNNVIDEAIFKQRAELKAGDYSTCKERQERGAMMMRAAEKKVKRTSSTA